MKYLPDSTKTKQNNAYNLNYIFFKSLYQDRYRSKRYSKQQSTVIAAESRATSWHKFQMKPRHLCCESLSDIDAFLALLHLYTNMNCMGLILTTDVYAGLWQWAWPNDFDCDVSIQLVNLLFISPSIKARFLLKGSWLSQSW